MAKSYESKDILVLEGLDAVRLRPGMYIGTTGSKGMHHLLWEIVDNAIDEASNNFADRIIITLHKDNSASVEDNGRGIPVDMHPTLKKSGVEVVFTQLHAGGKFNNDNYSYSGGLHGVGASVVNALSTWCKVNVYKDGKEYGVEFGLKQDSKGKVHGGITTKPLYEIGKTTKKGTLVTFLPDATIFGDEKFVFDVVSTRLKELAFLNKGLRIQLIDERTGTDVVYVYDGGLVDFASYINKGKTTLFSPCLYIEGSSSLVKLECAISYTDGYSENIFSFVNNIPTSEGGTHETGFKAAITKVLNDYARKNNFLKEKDQNLLGEDFREGISAILSIKMTQHWRPTATHVPYIINIKTKTINNSNIRLLWSLYKPLYQSLLPLSPIRELKFFNRDIEIKIQWKRRRSKSFKAKLFHAIRYLLIKSFIASLCGLDFNIFYSTLFTQRNTKGYGMHIQLLFLKERLISLKKFFYFATNGSFNNLEISITFLSVFRPFVDFDKDALIFKTKFI